MGSTVTRFVLRGASSDDLDGLGAAIYGAKTLVLKERQLPFARLFSGTR